MFPNILNTLILLSINLLIFTYAFWINYKLYKSYCYISLPFLFNLFFLFFYIITHTYIILSGNIQNYYKNIINSYYISYTAIFATLLNLFFNIGFIINLFFKNKKINFSFKYLRILNQNMLFKIGFSLFTIGVITKLTYFMILGGGNIYNYIISYFAIQLERISDAGGGTFEVYLNFLFIFLDVGTDLLLINTLKNNQHKNLTIICILLALLLSFNSRFVMIKLIFQYIIIICIYMKNIRKKIPILFLGVFIPIIFTLVIGLGLFRDSTNNRIINNLDPIYLLMGQFHPMRALADGISYSRQFGEKKYGKTIILPIIQKPIPRSIWKNKELNAGAIYTKTMSPGDLEKGFAIAPGIAFDAYINFGYIGSLLFFMLLGFIIFKIQTFLYKNIIFNQNNTLYAILLAILGSTLLTLRGADLSNIPIYVIYYIPILIIIFLKFKIKI